MILAGFLLGSLTNVGFGLIFYKFPAWLKNFLFKHPLLLDGTAAFLTYVLVGGTATGLFAAALAGIEVSLLLVLIKNSQFMSWWKLTLEKLKGLGTKALEALQGTP